jgi:hypothetical protein
MIRKSLKVLIIAVILYDLPVLCVKEKNVRGKDLGIAPLHGASLLSLRGGRRARDHSDEEKIDVIR